MAKAQCLTRDQQHRSVLVGGYSQPRPDENCALRMNGPLYEDRKSTRLNSSHMSISYAVFCLKKKKIKKKKYYLYQQRNNVQALHNNKQLPTQESQHTQCLCSRSKPIIILYYFWRILLLYIV